jgi:hypothetical protein
MRNPHSLPTAPPDVIQALAESGLDESTVNEAWLSIQGVNNHEDAFSASETAQSTSTNVTTIQAITTSSALSSPLSSSAAVLPSSVKLDKLSSLAVIALLTWLTPADSYTRALNTRQFAALLRTLDASVDNPHRRSTME